MNICPSAQFLLAEHRKDLGWVPALCELLDNSFDADATRVALELFNGPKGRELTVSDDGVGLSDHQVIFAQGRRADHEHGPGSGRYGVGAKLALLFFWGRCEVTSWLDGRRYDTVVTWQDLVDNDTLDIADTVSTHNEGRGTKIRITNVARRFIDPEILQAKLEDAFWPALEIGRQISLAVNGESVSMSNRMDRSGWQDHFTFDGSVRGKQYRAVAGLIVGETNPDPGFTIIKAHRIVTTGFQPALKGRSVPAFQCHVWLDDPDWKLTTTKDDLAEDADRAQLGRELASKCGDLLSKAEKTSRHMCLEGINNDLSCAVNETRRMRQATRNPKTGTVDPVESGRRRHDKPLADPGSKTAKVDGSQVKLSEFNGGASETVRIKVDRDEDGKKLIIAELNTNRDDIRILWNNPERMKSVVLLCIAAYSACHPEQALLSFEVTGRDFYRTWEETLSHWMHRVVGFMMS